MALMVGPRSIIDAIKIEAYHTPVPVVAPLREGAPSFILVREAILFVAVDTSRNGGLSAAASA